MRNVFRARRLGRCAIGLALCLAASVRLRRLRHAPRSYPDHAVRIIVPFPAGGTADAVPRILGDWLSRKWGQSVVIENHSGAGGNIGADVAYRAAPDGYTLLSSPPPPLVVNQNLYPSLPFDPAKFEPIVVTALVPTGLFVNPDKIKATNVARADRLPEAKSGQGDRRHARQRNDIPSHVRAFPDDGQGEAAQRALSRLGSGAAGPARRRRRSDVRQSRRCPAAGHSRQAQAARHSHRQAPVFFAGGADDRRDATGR